MNETNATRAAWHCDKGCTTSDSWKCAPREPYQKEPVAPCRCICHRRNLLVVHNAEQAHDEKFLRPYTAHQGENIWYVTGPDHHRSDFKFDDELGESNAKHFAKQEAGILNRAYNAAWNAAKEKHSAIALRVRILDAMVGEYGVPPCADDIAREIRES